MQMFWDIPCAKGASPCLGPRTSQRLGVECGSWGLAGLRRVITWAGQTRRQADSVRRMMQEGVGEGRDRCPEARVLRVPAPEGRGLPTELGQRRRPRRHQSALCGSCHCPLPLLLPVLPKIRVPLCAREIGAQGDRTVFIYWKWWEPGGGGCMPSVSLFEKLFVLYWGERK